MRILDDVEVRPLSHEFLDDAVRIHLAGMGYTLNARLGAQHLRRLYATMSDDTSCFVALATLAGRPAGVVSGSTDADEFTARLLASLPFTHLLQIALKMLRHPSFLKLWWQGREIGKPVMGIEGEIRAVLTAIVVDHGARGKGVGRALVDAFEDFLRDRGVETYKLDTRLENRRAADFYEGLGFVEAARRVDSIVYVKALKP